MGKHSKNKITWILVVGMIILAVGVLALALVLDKVPENPGSQNPPSGGTQQGEKGDTPINVSFSDFQILSTTETDGSVVIKTTFGNSRYPAAFSDLITVKAQSGEASASLQFFAQIDSKEIPVFTVHYGGSEGRPFGILSLSGDTDEITVAVAFADPPAGLSADDLTTFQAAQEVFNEILASMNEDARFNGM
jgi:hypothetical protein